jgi:hypothetical protein
LENELIVKTKGILEMEVEKNEEIGQEIREFLEIFKENVEKK